MDCTPPEQVIPRLERHLQYWGSALIRSVQYSPAVAGVSPRGSRAAILSVPCPYRLTVLATLGWLPRSRAGHPCLDLSQPVVRVRAGTPD
jgi:hypothetical protein